MIRRYCGRDIHQNSLGEFWLDRRPFMAGVCEKERYFGLHEPQDMEAR